MSASLTTREDPITGESAAAALLGTAAAHIAEHWGRHLSHDLVDEYAAAAYAELLEKHCEGEAIGHPKALIKKIAYGYTAKKVTRRRAELVDPQKLARNAVGHVAEPSEALAFRSDFANIAVLVDQLDEVEQAVYRAKFVDRLSLRQIAARVGRSKSTVDRTLRRLEEHFDAVFSASGEDGAKLKVLSAYAFGDKSVRRAAELLLKNDPTAAAILRGIKGTHEGAALLVPPALLETNGDTGILQRLGDTAGALRDRISGGGDHSAVSETATQIASSGAGRGGGAAAGGSIATITGALGAKGVALCAGGAATVACVAAVVTPFAGPDRGQVRPAEAAEAAERPAKPPHLPSPNPALVKPASSIEPTSPQRSPKPVNNGGDDGGGAAASAPQPRSAPTPANPSSPTDPAAYNPYNAASPAPAAPVPAPTPSSSDSGGGSSSGGCNPYDAAC